MSRLTRKVKYEGETLYGSPIGTKCDDFDQLQNIYNKLGKIEDIEAELGCPLEVVFKALMKGFYLKTIKGNIEHLYFDDISIYYETFYKWENESYIIDEVCMVIGSYYDKVKLKDYKKTWWLKEDLSE